MAIEFASSDFDLYKYVLGMLLANHPGSQEYVRGLREGGEIVENDLDRLQADFWEIGDLALSDDEAEKAKLNTTEA